MYFKLSINIFFKLNIPIRILYIFQNKYLYLYYLNIIKRYYLQDSVILSRDLLSMVSVVLYELIPVMIGVEIPNPTVLDNAIAAFIFRMISPTKMLEIMRRTLSECFALFFRTFQIVLNYLQHFV